jgi:hypothetical protein
LKNSAFSLLLLVFSCSFLFSSCENEEQKIKRAILGKFEGNLNDEEMDININYFFSNDSSLLAISTIKIKSGEEDVPLIKMDIYGSYNIIDGYLFMHYKRLRVEPAEFQEALEKEFVGQKLQNKILELNKEELILEEVNNEKWILKRVKR